MKDMRTELYRAAISCGHEITHEQIILYVDSRKEGNALSQLADRLEKAALSAVPENHIGDGNEMVRPELAKHQPCGCVICTCEHETQCQGCGAKNCGTHAAGDIPNPVFKAQQPAQEPTYEDHDTAKHHEWLKKVETENAGKVNELICDVPAQEPVKPAGFISAKTVEWLNSIGEMIDAKMELTFRTEPSVEPYTIPFYLAPQEPVKQESWISVEEAKATLKDGDLIYVAFENGKVEEAVYRFEQGFYPHRITSSYGNERIENCTNVMRRNPIPLPLPPVKEVTG